MAKCTEGVDFVDPEFARNWESMGDIQSSDAGQAIWRFAYLYFHPGEDPATQARHLVNTAMPLGFIPGRDHFVLDHEETDGLSPMDVSFAAWVCAHTIRTLVPESRVIIYTYPYFAIDGYCAMLGEHSLWIADYGVPTPYVPPPWRGRYPWSFWQDSSNGGGNKDLFNGDDNKLKEFCSTTRLQVP
jgi:GH25 family lysozyme M1 (1,4-beta-N-acetylmuramidase)